MPLFGVIVAVALSTTSASQTNPINSIATDKSKFVGFWRMVRDEDGTSTTDTMEFTSDGTYVMHGFQCSIHVEVPYHIYKGNLYGTIEVPGKGPIAIIFHPNSDGQLIFTSPRTRNNAYYERISENPCPTSK